MAKIKATFSGKLTNVGFTPGTAPQASFEHAVGEKLEDGYQPVGYISVPVDAKRVAKLLNVTDVEITITVTPKGAKKAKKAKKAVAATTTPATTPVVTE